MDRINAEHYRNMLLEKEKELHNTIDSMKKYDKGEFRGDRSTELSNYDNHPADSGSQLYQDEMQNALIIHEENILKDINAALKKIDNGTYGKCVSCGSEISQERLEAVPYAGFCIDCEKSRLLTLEEKCNGRPNEELVIDTFMGRKYLNKREDDEYEGLDYFNDLMKYGSSDSPQDLGGYHDYKEFFTNEIDKQGIVDDMDNISNSDYKRQLPG